MKCSVAGHSYNLLLCPLADIDECAFPGRCPHPSKCRNTIGGYKCECPKGFVEHRHKICIGGYRLLQFVCRVWFDFCLKFPICADSRSLSCLIFNVAVKELISLSFSLSLSPSPSPSSFVDEDECSVNNGGCSQRCHNFPGSYRCGCFHGYTMQADRRTCKGQSWQIISCCLVLKRYFGLSNFTQGYIARSPESC